MVKSPGRERGAEKQKEIGGKRQEVREEDSRDRECSAKGGGAEVIYGVGELYIVVLISCWHFTKY